MTLPVDIAELASDTKVLFDATSPLSTAGRAPVRLLTSKIQSLVGSIDSRIPVLDLRIGSTLTSSGSQMADDVIGRLSDLQTQVSLVIGRGAAGRALVNIQQVVT